MGKQPTKYHRSLKLNLQIHWYIRFQAKSNIEIVIKSHIRDGVPYHINITEYLRQVKGVQPITCQVWRLISRTKMTLRGIAVTTSFGLSSETDLKSDID